MAASPDVTSMALFCDFENIALGVSDAKYDKFDIKKVLERLLLKGSIVVKKAYCDWDRYKPFKRAMHEASFELIEIPHVRQAGKNSADIRLVVDALDLCYTKAHVDTFVIISGDSDFSPLVSKLRENDKTVIGVGVKNSTSDLLIANCDEFIFYDDLVREEKRRAPAARPAARQSGAGRTAAAGGAPAAAAGPAADTAKRPARGRAGAAASGAAAGNGKAAPAAAGSSRRRGARSAAQEAGVPEPAAVEEAAGDPATSGSRARKSTRRTSPSRGRKTANAEPAVAEASDSAGATAGEAVAAAATDNGDAAAGSEAFASDAEGAPRVHPGRSRSAAEASGAAAGGAPGDADRPGGDRAEDARHTKAIDKVMSTVEALVAERGDVDALWGSMVKQTLKRREPGFNEAYFGFRSFNALLEEAHRRGLITLERDEKSGGYKVRLATTEV